MYMIKYHYFFLSVSTAQYQSQKSIVDFLSDPMDQSYGGATDASLVFSSPQPAIHPRVSTLLLVRWYPDSQDRTTHL